MKYANKFKIGHIFFGPVLISLLGIAACSTPSTGTVPTPTASASLLPVDCMLPGQVRKLGQVLTYLSARRATKTSANDCELRGGEYVAYDRADYQSSLAVWMPLAEQGDAKAQNFVGEIYERGLGTQPDLSQAVEWYRKAADNGSNAAKINLGQMYERGAGVAGDMEAALQWYREAAGFSEKQLKFVSFDYDEQALPALRAEVAELNVALEESVAAKNSLQQELDTARARQRKLVAASNNSAELQSLRAELLGLEQKLVNRESLLLEKNAALENARNRLYASQSATTSDFFASRGPNIEILQPQLLKLDEGRFLARTREASAPQELIGRVRSAQELREVAVNGKRVRLNTDGLFRHRFRLQENEPVIHVSAVDNLGWRSDLEFFLSYADSDTGDSGTDLLEETPSPLVSAPIPRLGYGNYRALLIANEDYTNLEQLDTPANDVNALGKILVERYGFQVTKLFNASRYDILSALEILRQQLREDDNLLIYYAGHGDLDQVNGRGHWLPIDADKDNRANWISNVALSDSLNAMPVRKVLVVADSCYSGAMTRSPIARFQPRNNVSKEWQPWLTRQLQQKSRLLLSSGAIAPVQDGGSDGHSVFAGALLDVLERNRGVLEGRVAHARVARSVVAASRETQFEQNPQYAPLKYTGHEGGDFLFVPLDG